jgi:hypothetical protein
MRIKTHGRVRVVELEVAAPIAAGHEVVAFAFVRKNAGFFDLVSSCEAVLDVTSGVLHADATYWSVLTSDRPLPEHPPALDPVAALGPDWTAKTSVRGRVQGALVSTKDGGELNHARTLLHLEPLDVPPGYRG